MKTQYRQITIKTGVKAGDSERLTIYGTSTCPWCKKQKEYLDSKKISYKFVDCSAEQCPDFVSGYPTAVVNGYYEY